MYDIKEAQSQLATQDFDDAREAVASLIELQQSGYEQIVRYFRTLVTQASDPFAESTFTLVNGKFTVTIPELKESEAWPIQPETFRLLSEMGKIVDADTLKVIVADYSKLRSAFLKKSLRPLFKKSRDMLVSTGPADVLDIGTYQRLSHPMHLLAQSLNYLALREKNLIQRIFPLDHIEIFIECMRDAFKSFTKTVNKLLLPALNSHIDVLFNLDLLTTLREIMADFSLLGDTSQRSDKSMTVVLMDLMQPLMEITRVSLISFTDLFEKHDPTFVPLNG
jgi:exocyst complex protein 7